MPAKQQEIIFVRGGKTDERFPWRFFHFHPTRNVAIQNARLTYFNYPDQEIQIWHSWNGSRQAKVYSQPDQRLSMTPLIEIREENLVVNSSIKLPSVLLLYNYINSRPAGSIRSLQIFSHGDYDGPIIWNFVYELDKTQTADRDPHDTEFRKKDFFGRNPLAGTSGRTFRTRFMTGAFIKIWGCNEDPRYRVKLRQIQRSRTVAIKHTLIQTYLDEIDDTYAVLLSKLLGQTVWAVPLGWGSNPWPNRNRGESYRGRFPPHSNDNWWKVPAFSRRFRRIFRSDLRAPIDPLGYIGYNTTWITRAKRAVRVTP